MDGCWISGSSFFVPEDRKGADKPAYEMNGQSFI